MAGADGADDARRLFVLMGPAGSGKSTVGAALQLALSSDPAAAARGGCTFLDADECHPRENVAKMSRGEALSDEDRALWLDRIAAALGERAGASAAALGVLACSALRRRFRDALALRAREAGWEDVAFVLLDVSARALASRLERRAEERRHFFPPSLLPSQLAALELGDDLHVVPADPASGGAPAVADAIASRVVKRLAWERSLRAFLERWRALALARGLERELDPARVVVDHACWRCATPEAYESALRELRAMGHRVAGSGVVAGRVIATVALARPLAWRGFAVPAVEVPMPKPGRPKPDGWEHAEVALMEGAMEGDTEALRALRARHPTLPWREEGLEKAMNPELALDLGDGVAAKFHARPLLDVVRREIELGVATKGSAFTTTADDDDKAEALSDDATGPEPRSARAPKNPPAAADEKDDDAFADPSVLFGLETREPFASAMIRGEKTIETRRYDLPRALLGRPIVLLATPASDAPRSELRDVVPAGAATVLGVVTFERAPPDAALAAEKKEKEDAAASPPRLRHATWPSFEAWAADEAKHAVAPDPRGAHAWRPGDGEPHSGAYLRGWRVVDAVPMPPRPSPPMTRATRSLFRLEATVEDLLRESPEEGPGGGDEEREEEEGGEGEEGREATDDGGDGRWDDEGEMDRPWH